MKDIWDMKADAVNKGDKLRDISPILDKIWKDENCISRAGQTAQ